MILDICGFDLAESALINYIDLFVVGRSNAHDGYLTPKKFSAMVMSLPKLYQY